MIRTDNGKTWCSSWRDSPIEKKLDSIICSVSFFPSVLIFLPFSSSLVFFFFFFSFLPFSEFNKNCSTKRFVWTRLKVTLSFSGRENSRTENSSSIEFRECRCGGMGQIHDKWTRYNQLSIRKLEFFQPMILDYRLSPVIVAECTNVTCTANQ